MVGWGSLGEYTQCVLPGPLASKGTRFAAPLRGGGWLSFGAPTAADKILLMIIINNGNSPAKDSSVGLADYGFNRAVGFEP